MARTWRFMVAGVVLLIGLLWIVRPALVELGGHARLLVLLRGQSGAIHFVNSVTAQPVAITFRIGRRFEDFSVTTDPTTEAYYTHGLFALNDGVAQDATPVLRLCSMKGIHLRLGWYRFDLKDVCLEVRLLWTI